MTKEEFQKLLRYLKSKGLKKGDVAAKLVVSAGYMSKLGSPEKPITAEMEKTIRGMFGAELKAMNEKGQKGQKGSSEIPEELGNHPHTDKLIQVLENRLAEEKRILENHNAFLQDLVKSSLTGMRANQNVGAGILIELLQRDIDREAKGNPGKKKKILHEIAKKIGPDFDIINGMGIPAGDGTSSIR